MKNLSIPFYYEPKKSTHTPNNPCLILWTRAHILKSDSNKKCKHTLWKIITCKTLKKYSDMFDELQIKNQHKHDNFSRQIMQNLRYEVSMLQKLSYFVRSRLFTIFVIKVLKLLNFQESHSICKSVMPVAFVNLIYHL